jgi:hypothetical protein
LRNIRYPFISIIERQDFGYEVYRFGGFELMEKNARETVEPFLNRS